MLRSRLILVIILLMTIYKGASQNADQIILDMGYGFNLGNVYDNGNKSITLNNFDHIIDFYHDAGMQNIRIPVTWMSNVDGSTLVNYNGDNLNTTHYRFVELKKTIDYCLNKGLYVILNTHHEEWLKDNYDGSSAYDMRFYNLWTEIANYFKHYSKKLIFEVLNEPEGAFGQNDGSGPWPDPGTGQTNAFTRQINQVGYDAIRNTGGNNSTRLIMVSPNGQSADQYIKSVYPDSSYLPGGGIDTHLALQVHTYDPWGFCGQTGSNKNYTSSYINNKIITEISQALNDANSLGVPLHYGEFGVGRNVNQNERDTSIVRSYYRTVMETCINNGAAVTVWDDRGWFRLINDSGPSFTFNIVPYMLENIRNTEVSSLAYYHLVNNYTDDYMRPTNGSSTALITQFESASTPTFLSTEWEFIIAPTRGYYYIINKHTNKAMQTTGASTTENATISQTEITSANQNYPSLQWRLIPSISFGYYWIQNKWSGLYIRPSNGNDGTGVNMVQNSLVSGHSSFKWGINTSGNNVSKQNNYKKSSSNKMEEVFTNVFNVHPNPARTYLNVEIPTSNNSTSLEIYSATGKRVYETSVSNFESKQIDVSTFSSGMYFVRLIGAKVLYTRFLVK